MIPINIDITRCGGLLSMHIDNRHAGTQYDNEVTVLRFTRPEELAGHDLILLFRAFDGTVYRENLGTANAYTMPNALTQSRQLELQIAFQLGDEYREAVGMELLTLREGMDGSITPEPIPDVVAALEHGAHVGEMTYADSMLTAYNLQGDPVSSVEIRGGGVAKWGGIEGDIDNQKDLMVRVGQKPVFLFHTYEQGSIASATGQNQDSAARVRTAELIPVTRGETYYLLVSQNAWGTVTDLEYIIMCYNEDGSFRYRIADWQAFPDSPTPLEPPDSATAYIRWVVRHADGVTTIAPGDIKRSELQRSVFAAGGGKDGVTFTPAVATDGDISWTNDGGLPNPEPVNIMGPMGQDGSDGRDGRDGVSPVATASKTGSVATITITDAEGTTTATVSDGAIGPPGPVGPAPVRGVDYWTQEDQAAMESDLQGYIDAQLGVIVNGLY